MKKVILLDIDKSITSIKSSMIHPTSSMIDEHHESLINFMNQTKTSQLFHNNAVIKLGGQTIFDIFPSGWDKSYVFKDFESFERIDFIGDKCDSMGIYHKGFAETRDHGIQTDGTKPTCRILSEILRGSTRKDTLSSPVQAPTPRGRYNHRGVRFRSNTQWAAHAFLRSARRRSKDNNNREVLRWHCRN